MTFSRGTLLLVDFTSSVDDGRVIDTTKGAKSGPKLISIGDVSFPVLRGFDEVLAKSGVGESISETLPPEKGYGKRDPGKIRMVPLRKFGDKADSIGVGDVVTLNDKQAVVRHVGSGRVQLDYNHQHAGKAIKFEATILKELKEDREIVEGIIGERFPAGSSSVEMVGRAVIVDIDESIFRHEGLQTMKSLTQQDIFKFASGISRIVFKESFVKEGAEDEDEDLDDLEDDEDLDDEDEDEDLDDLEDDDEDLDDLEDDDEDLDDLEDDEDLDDEDEDDLDEDEDLDDLEDDEDKESVPKS